MIATLARGLFIETRSYAFGLLMMFAGFAIGSHWSLWWVGPVFLVGSFAVGWAELETRRP